jgi:hypothetical protein
MGGGDSHPKDEKPAMPGENFQDEFSCGRNGIRLAFHF